MTKIKDMFGDLALNEPIEIELEGKTLELDMRTKDLHPLISLGQSQGDMDEEHVEKLTDLLRRLLSRSYLPHYNKAEDEIPDNLGEEEEKENEEAKEYIEGLLVRYYLKIFVQITQELNWQSDVDAESLQEKKGNFPQS